jgi:hypothetical protein
MHLDVAELEKRYSEMSADEFNSIKRIDLLPIARRCYDREANRRGLPPASLEIHRIDPRDLLRKMEKKKLKNIAKYAVVFLIFIVLEISASAVYGHWIIGPSTIFVLLLTLHLIMLSARGSATIMWLRRFHIKHKRALRFYDLLGTAAYGLGSPITVQDSTFKRTHTIASSILNTFFPLILVISSGASFYLYSLLPRSDFSMFISLCLFAVLAWASFLYIYMKLSCINLKPRNAQKRMLKLIRKIQNGRGWQTLGVLLSNARILSGVKSSRYAWDLHLSQ